MDTQTKIMMTMKCLNNCTLTCYVHCATELVVTQPNEEILVVDFDGVAHEAIINFCPTNANTIDIRDFMNLFMKINRMSSNSDVNGVVDEENSN